MKNCLRHIFLALLLCFSISAKAQTPHLGDSAYAALITCGAGDEFYTTFGHSAIRICDSTQGIDFVYNYGMFSFNTEHFYWTFSLGNLNYWVERDSFKGFLWEYEYYGRQVWMQKLNISNQELNNLFVALEWNVLPENRYYKYDFFRDNCATRARDMIFNCLSHRTVIAEQRTKDDPSYRNEIYLRTDSTLLWWRFGIDLLLGARCDQHTSNLEQMFSPLNMMAQFDTLVFSDTKLPLASDPEVILEERREPLTRSISPTLAFWALCVVVISLTIISWKKGWKMRWLDAILFGIVGFLSLVILFLWGVSSHYCTKINLNLLWCSPLMIYFCARIRKSHRIMVMIQGAMLLIFLVGFWWMPQEFNQAFFPIALMLLVRLLNLLRNPLDNNR